MKLTSLKSELFTIIISLLILPIMLAGSDNAECAEDVYYYSIHIASFEMLQNANSFINSLAKKGKMVFWKKTDVPGKGEFYRVYMGKYKDKDNAVELWNILKQQGAVSYFGIHRFREAALTAKKEEPAAIKVPKKEDVVDATIPEPKEERFVDNGDGTITDTKTNLMWVKNGWRIDFFSAIKWKDAVKKCEDFRHRGYTNWRLPTIKEWKSLLDPNKEYPALTDPNPFENIIVHMPYWSNTEYNARQTASLNPSRAYTVMLYYGRIAHQNVNKRAFVMPVRSVE